MMLPMTDFNGLYFTRSHVLANWHVMPGASVNHTATALLVLSTVIGFGAGVIYLPEQQMAKAGTIASKALQDFFAYDFYTAQLYRVTVIFAVGLVAQVISWVDRNIVDGFVNLIGFATVFGGKSLKYNVNGQTQFYALTILFGVALLDSHKLAIASSLVADGGRVKRYKI